jgi:hypothetical protein
MSEDAPHYGPMTEQRAMEILNGVDIFSDMPSLGNGEYTNWHEGDATVKLDGRFTAEELEAIVWWMRNKP